MGVGSPQGLPIFFVYGFWDASAGQRDTGD